MSIVGCMGTLVNRLSTSNDAIILELLLLWSMSMNSVNALILYVLGINGYIILLIVLAKLYVIVGHWDIIGQSPL